jgi:predicted O-methyltransferase YrrM
MIKKLPIRDDDYSFKFSRRWFLRRNSETFTKYVYPKWVNKPITYLEIGVFEGMSLVWMLQWVLRNKQSRAIGCDPWLMMPKWPPEKIERVRQHALHNIKPYSDKCTLIRGNSSHVLRSMLEKNGFSGITKDSVDLLMIDGSHHYFAVLDDARMSIQLIKVGGWLLFDDVENSNRKKDHVRKGIDLFLEDCGDKVKLVWKHNYMEAYEKIK